VASGFRGDGAGKGSGSRSQSGRKGGGKTGEGHAGLDWEGGAARVEVKRVGGCEGAPQGKGRGKGPCGRY